MNFFLKSKYDCRDFFVMLSAAAVIVTATIFLFKHPDPGNFVTWAGVVTTVFGVYHWVITWDQKKPDACSVPPAS